MSKKRVYEYAKEHGLSSKEVIQKAEKLGIVYQSHMSTMSEADLQKLSQPVQPKVEKVPVKVVEKDKNPMVMSQEKRNQSNKPNFEKNNQNKEQKQDNRQFNRNQDKFNKKDGMKEDTKRFERNNRNERRNEFNKNNGENRSFNKPNDRQERVNRDGNQQRQNNGEFNRNRNFNQRTNGENKSFNRDNKKDGNRPAFNRDNKDFKPRERFDNKGFDKDSDDKPVFKSQPRNNKQKENKDVVAVFDNNYNKRVNGKKQQQNRRDNDSRYEDGHRGKKKGANLKKVEMKKPEMPQRKFKELPEVLVYTEGMTVADISKRIYRDPSEIIKKLFMMGVMATLNQSLSADAIELLAADYGIEAEAKVIIDNTDLDSFFDAEIDETTLVERAPVVTIMGHVDHGKTTLLDYLRKSSVIETEAGGITQHIGAYQVDVNGKIVTFLDTPGHAAFSAMRARGADITDITIIVVAADDGVMPQTIEAINHAKAAELPIIVAVNKIDKPTANPSRVMQELSEHGVVAEAWGGDVPFIEISAKFGQNIEELLEMILLVAEMQELKASADRLALGTVIEAKLDPSRGAVATLLIQHGTLNVGDPIVVGNTYGKVRTMVNDHGRRVKHALPSAPVEITGLNEAPQAGDRFVVFKDEKTARAAGEQRAKNAQIEQRNARQHVTLDNLFASLKEGELKDVNVIIKADVQGSAEALSASLQKIDVEGVRVRIVHSAVGAINESDITLAAASNAIIIGFNVRPTPQAKVQAEDEQVDIRLHNIIYRVIEEIETAMKGMLDPEYEEKIIGQVVVRETYKVSKVGTIAGAYVLEGRIERNCKVRVIRDSIVIHDGELASLKRFKDDVKEVKLGYECGLMITNFNDLQVDDIIEPYIMVEIERK